MQNKYEFRLYRDVILSEPRQPIWSGIGQIENQRFIVFGQVEIHSESDNSGAISLEFTPLGQDQSKTDYCKLEIHKRRRKTSDPHLAGFLKVEGKKYAGAVWMQRDEEEKKYFRLKLLELKKPPSLRRRPTGKNFGP